MMRDGHSQPTGTITVPPELMIWLSPAFPVGAFAYSHGLEWAAEKGWIGGRDDLERWLGDLVTCGSLRNDLVLLAQAWRAVVAGEWTVLAEANEIAIALQPSAERRLETVTQGTSFLTAVAAAWPAGQQSELSGAMGSEIAYPIGVGAAAAAHGHPCDSTLLAYAIAFASSLVSAAIRLSVIGQTDGQRVLAALMPMLNASAHFATSSTLDDLGSATLRSDFASLAHETQYTRLFRS